MRTMMNRLRAVFMRIFNRISLLILCVLFPIALQAKAADIAVDGLYTHGFYLGAQLAYVDIHNDHVFTWDEVLFPLFAHLGGRALAGYHFNDYFALEAGYDYITDKKETGGFLQSDKHAKIYGFDVVGKGSLPLNHYFSLFLKAGLSRMHQDILDSIDNGQTTLYRSNTNQWMPVASPGIDIHFTPSFALEGFWMRFFKQNEIQNIDMFGLGVEYTF